MFQSNGSTQPNLPLTIINWINRPSFLGPKLPYTLRQSAMVTSPAGNGVIIIGGNGENNGESYHPKIMLELKTKTTDSRSTMEWVELSQKLISTRESPIAIAIPDDLSP